MFRAGVVAAIGIGVSASVVAAPHYSIVDIGEKVGSEYAFSATGLNASGQISGSASYKVDPASAIPQQPSIKAVVYDANGLRIAAAFGRKAEARAISAAGHTTGITDDANAAGHFAFLDNGSSAHILESPKRLEAVGNAINSRDQIAGVYTGRWNDPGDLAGRNTHRPFFYDGEFHDLGLGGGGEGEATALNDAGIVVGYMGVGMERGEIVQHAFRYDGQLHDLGTVPDSGCSATRATAINNKGVIVGTAELCKIDSTRGFIYDGAMHEIPRLDNARSTALAINSAGDVVGSAVVKGAFHAILVQGGVTTDLNAQVPELHDLILGEAIGINDAGQILARGSQRGVYLLTPMPESEATALIRKNEADAAAKQAAYLASVDVWSGSLAKITRDGASATLTYADAANRPHSFAVVRPKMAAGMLGNTDTGSWIYVAPDHKSGVMFNVSASGGVSGKAMNPLMMQMMVGQ